MHVLLKNKQTNKKPTTTKKKTIIQYKCAQQKAQGL
jgi:hypothetical protein